MDITKACEAFRVLLEEQQARIENANEDKNYKQLTTEERQFQINKILAVWNDFISINDPDLGVNINKTQAKN